MSSFETKQRLIKELADLTEAYKDREYIANSYKKADGRRDRAQDQMARDARRDARLKQAEIHELEEEVRKKDNKGRQSELLDGAPDPEPEAQSKPQEERTGPKKKKKKKNPNQIEIDLKRAMKVAAVVKASEVVGKRIPKGVLEKLMKFLKGAAPTTAMPIFMIKPREEDEMSRLKKNITKAPTTPSKKEA